MRQTRTLILLVLASAALIAMVSSWQYIGISIPNASALVADSGIGVYWDQAATKSCQSINWGTLTPRSSKTVVIYLKNEKSQDMVYSLTTAQWNPVNASKYMILNSNYSGTRVRPGSVLSVSLTLSVSPKIAGIYDFSFQIIISGNTYKLGDVDHDGRVDMYDLALIARAYGAVPGAPNWNAEADLNGDRRINTQDLAMAALNYQNTNG